MANQIFIEVQNFLGGVDYPASRDELVAAASEAGAGDTVLEALRGLPDRQFDGPTAVSEGLAS